MQRGRAVPAGYDLSTIVPGSRFSFRLPREALPRPHGGRMTRDSSAPASRASKLIPAPVEDVYAAFLDPVALLEWLPPAEMTGRMHDFDGRVGGGYTMSLYYPATETQYRGKSAEREDRVRVRFVELSPPRRIVEAVTFVTDDPAFAGEMMMTISLAEAPGGTEATLAFGDLPPGLRPEDNDEGARLSLEQLARRFLRPPSRDP